MNKRLQYLRYLLKEHSKSLRVLIVLLAVLIFAKVAWNYFVPTGGELFPRDFRGGFTLYVREGYSFSVGSDAVTDSPHSLWRVEEEELRSQIYDLCRDISRYREFDPVIDVRLGGSANRSDLPSIYIITDNYGYKIDRISWEDYAIPVWDKSGSTMKAYDFPLFRFYRIDLSLCPDGSDLLDFVMDYQAPDTVNKEGCLGWYSLLSGSSVDELPILLNSVSPSNSTEIR